jgi:hypothetical protein
MKFKTLAALMIMNMYALPMGDNNPRYGLAKRQDDHDHADHSDNDHDHQHSSETTDHDHQESPVATGPVPPGIPLADTSTIDIPALPSKALIPWYSLVTLNPQLNPNYVPAGAVVVVPPGSAWIARNGETILSVAQHFVKCYYGPKATLNPYLLARMNRVYGINTPLPPGSLVRLPSDAGYLAYAPTTFAFISRYLSFMGPTHPF